MNTEFTHEIIENKNLALSQPKYSSSNADKSSIDSLILIKDYKRLIGFKDKEYSDSTSIPITG